MSRKLDCEQGDSERATTRTGIGVGESRTKRSPAVRAVLVWQGTAGNRATAALLQRATRPIGGGGPLPLARGVTTTGVTGSLPSIASEMLVYPVVQRDYRQFEHELLRLFTDPDDPALVKRRATLLRLAEGLTDLERYTLISSVLGTSNPTIADRFLRLSASTRFEVLKVLCGRMHLGAEYLLPVLTPSTDRLPPADSGYAARFKRLVPDSRHRQQLLKVMSDQSRAAHQPDPQGPLWVHWHFRNTGWFSPDNDANKSGHTQLGTSLTVATNVMELRGDVVGHTAGNTYDIVRNVDMRSWELVAGRWKEKNSLKPGSNDDRPNDDSHDADEDLTPEPYGHLYVIDGPGQWGDISADATGYVYKANFREVTYAKIGGTGDWKQVSDVFDWHSVSNMEKVNGHWKRRITPQGPDHPTNEINIGHQELTAP